MSWIYLPNLFENEYNDRSVYEILVDECDPYFVEGTLKMMGKEYVERRLTCYFSLNDTPMTYSGRSVEPVLPPEGSYIAALIQEINSETFRNVLAKVDPILDLEF